MLVKYIDFLQLPAPPRPPRGILAGGCYQQCQAHQEVVVPLGWVNVKVHRLVGAVLAPGFCHFLPELLVFGRAVPGVHLQPAGIDNRQQCIDYIRLAPDGIPGAGIFGKAAVVPLQQPGGGPVATVRINRYRSGPMASDAAVGRYRSGWTPAGLCPL